MLRITLSTFFFCLVLGAKTQIGNNGFESLHITSTDTLPAQWTVQDFGGGLSENAHTGNYALSVWNWYYYGKGFAASGEVVPGWMPFEGSPFLHAGEPISFKPLALDGFYQYDTTLNSGAIDSALVQITLSRYNTVSGIREAVGFGEAKLPVATQYEPFHIPVQYSSALMPDTVVVDIMSSLNGFCNSTNGRCLYLTVDDLTLASLSGMVDFNHKNQTANTYPNPANNMLTIDATHLEGHMTRCILTSINGAPVLQKDMIQNTIAIDVSALSPGLYFYQLQDQDGNIRCTGKTEINR